MASLTGTKIKNTYDGLLKTNDNEPLDAALITITDGLGNGSALSLSSVAAQISGDLDVTGNFDVNGSVINFSNTNGKLVTNLSGVTENVISSYVSSTNSDYEKIRISSEQFIVNTGSGTSSSQRLVIAETGLATFANNVVVDGTLSVGSFGVFDASVTADSVISTEGVYQAGSGAETGLMFPALDEISLKINNTERLGLDSTGASVTGTLSVSGISTFDNKVGIGSSSFEAFDVLHISGTNAVANDLTFIGPSTSQVRIKFGAPSSLDGEIAYDNDAKSMKFRTNSSERLLLNSSGASVTGTLGVSGAATLSTSLEVVGNQFSENGDISLTNGDLNLTNGNLVTGGSIVHLGDTNTYFTFRSNDNISLFAGGNEMLLVSSVGAEVRGRFAVSDYTTIGGTLLVTDAATLSSTLAVTGNINLKGAATGIQYILTDGTSSGNTGEIKIVAGAGSTDFGSGITLYGRNHASYAGSLYLGASQTAGDIIFGKGQTGLGVETMRIYASKDISFRDSSANEAFYWDASAARLSLGAGSAPSATLHIGGGGRKLYSNNETTSYAYMQFENTGGDFTLGIDRSIGGGLMNGSAAYGTVFGTNNATALCFGTNLTERMRIDSSGNVGIGVNASDYWTNANNLVVGSLGAVSGITIATDGNLTGSLIFADGTGGGDNARGGLQYNHSTDYMLFRVDNAERMRIASNGNVSIAGDLSLTPTNSAITFSSGYARFFVEATERMRILPTGGITFNGDTSTANALDDYEEGTFTPTFAPTSGAFSSITYSVQYGKYTKIGNRVDVNIQITLSALSVGTAGGVLSIGGLPFTVGAKPCPFSITIVIDWESGKFPINGFFNDGASNCLLRYLPALNANDAYVGGADITPTSQITLSGTYFV